MHGCNGHMGQVISSLVEKDPNAQIVAGIDIADNGNNSYPVFTDMEACDTPADVVIDFSSPKAADQLMDYCVRRSLPLVLCTTGLSEAQLAKVEESAKKVAVLAVNPVNGCGLFQYLEAFFENGISYKVFAVSDTKDIKTNSGISLTVDDVIANLKGHEDEFDALVFSCGDAVPVFQQNADKPYNVDLMQVIKTFGDKGKIMIGHCAGAMMFDFTGITKGKKVAVHPLAKPAIQNGTATDEKSEIDGNFFTAQDENTIWTMMPQVIKALK